jgi:hypothetical protein
MPGQLNYSPKPPAEHSFSGKIQCDQDSLDSILFAALQTRATFGPSIELRGKMSFDLL